MKYLRLERYILFGLFICNTAIVISFITLAVVDVCNLYIISNRGLVLYYNVGK